MTFIGRTIVGIEEIHDGCVLLRLDDGTAVEAAIDGYYDNGLIVTHLTDDVLLQRAIDAEAERAAHEEEIRRSVEAGERKRAHIEQMRAELDPEAFEMWRVATYPTLTETLQDVWTDPRIQEQLSR